jgi:hypothetical protein
MRPKRFPSLWYVQRKPCPYLASRIALSLKGPKHAFTWASSPRGTIVCVQNDLWANDTSSMNHADLASKLTLSPNEKRDSTWPTLPRSFIGWVQNDFWAYDTFDANHAPNLHQDQHYLHIGWAFTWASSPRSIIGCVKMISKPMVHLSQTVHQTCTNTNTLSKLKEERFDMTHVT